MNELMGIAVISMDQEFWDGEMAQVREHSCTSFMVNFSGMDLNGDDAFGGAWVIFQGETT